MNGIEAILLVGPTGSGKTPLGSEIEKRGLFGKRAHHFDFGSNLRAVANFQLPLPERDINLIRKILYEGRLLKPEEFYLAESILKAFLHSRDFSPEDILILNGLPRNQFQAEKLTEKVYFKGIIHLSIEISVLKERLTIDPAGDRKGRTDDSEEYLVKKLEWFQRETLPMLQYFQSKGTEILELRVEKTDTGSSLYDKLINLILK